jgi:hypothetical protein
MNANDKTAGMQAMKGRLSALWVFAMFNYIYADIIGFLDPGFLKELMTTGYAGSIYITQEFMLAAAILMEIPIAMVLLSRILKHRANRWANIIAGTIMTASITLSMFDGPTLHYLFFGTIEIVCTALIVWYAWKWRNPEVSPEVSPDSIALNQVEFGENA